VKVVALFQVYLPFFLPRTPEWSEAEYLQFEFETEGHLVKIHPRKQDEPLFPRPVDEKVSNLDLDIDSDFIMPVDAPSKIRVRDRCFDRVEAQVYGEVSSKEECEKEEVIREYLRAALTGCNDFLYHCRVAGRDPDITTVTWYYSFEDRAYYLSHPFSLMWYGEDDRQPLKNDKGELMEQGGGGSVRSPGRKPIDLTLLEQTLRKRVSPNLPESLLVSAKERLMSDQLREGIIDIASACEIAATQYIDRKGMSGDAQVERIVADRRGHSFAERHYHLVPSYIETRSLQTEDPAAYDLLEKAYRTRNSLAHAGELTYKDSGNVIVVTRPMVNDFFRAGERAVEWINAL